MSSFPNLSPGTVKTGPVDVLAGLAVGGFGTYMAAKSPTLRWTYKGKDSPWLDYRFGAVLLGTAGWLMGSGMAARAGLDLAQAAGHSLMTTELVRRQAMKNLQGGGAGQLPGGAQPAQLPPPAADQVQGMPAFAGVGGFGMPGSFR